MTQPDQNAHPHPQQRGGSPPEYPPPERKRPTAVWTVSIILTILGVIGLLFSQLILSDLGSHGESVNPAIRGVLYVQILLSLTQIGAALALLPGYSAARIIAIIVCVLNLIGAVITLLTGAFAAIFAIIINGALIRALTSDAVQDWCDRRPATGN